MSCDKLILLFLTALYLFCCILAGSPAAQPVAVIFILVPMLISQFRRTTLSQHSLDRTSAC